MAFRPQVVNGDDLFLPEGALESAHNREAHRGSLRFFDSVASDASLPHPVSSYSTVNVPHAIQINHKVSFRVLNDATGTTPLANVPKFRRPTIGGMSLNSHSTVMTAYSFRRENSSLRRVPATAAADHHQTPNPVPDTPTSPATATEDATSQRPIKLRNDAPPCVSCTIPISWLFGVAFGVLTIVFVVITAVPNIQYTEEITDLVHETFAAGLQGASIYIRDALKNSASIAQQYKVMIEAAPEQYGCDDSSAAAATFPGGASNNNFFFDAGGIALARPELRYIYQVRQSSRFFYPDGAPMPTICMANPKTHALVYFSNQIIMSVPLSNGSDLGNLSALPVTTSPGDIQDADIVVNPLGNSWSAGGGFRWLGSVIPGQYLDNSTVPTKFSLFLSIKDSVNASRRWAFSIDHDMSQVRNMLLHGTPPVSLADITSPSTQYDGAHTSLYELHAGTLLSSTHPNLPTVTPSGAMWKAGETPVAEVNDAFMMAQRKCLSNLAGSDSCDTTAFVGRSGDSIRAFFMLKDAKINLTLLFVSSVPRKHFFAKSERTFGIALALACSCCVLLLVGGVAILFLIYRPLARLQHNMLEAANLHNDCVVHTHSYIRDIAEVSGVFDQMNQQLLIARSFVPEAVLLGKSEESQHISEVDEGSILADDDEELDGDSDSPFKNVKHPHPPSEHEGGSVLTGGTAESSGSGGMPKLFNVAERRISVLSLNVLGFHHLCGHKSHRIHDLSTALLSLAVYCAHHERGVMDSFHGDHFTITFNASRAVAGPLAAAVRTANDFIHRLSADKDLQLSTATVAAGAAGGKAHIGTFGIDGYRRMSVIGAPYRAATALQLAAAQFLRLGGFAATGAPVGCLVEGTSEQELTSNAFHLQMVGCIQSSRHRSKRSTGGNPPTVACFAHDATDCGGVGGGQGDEWLYELDAMDAGDPYRGPNDAIVHLLNGEIDECQGMLDAHRAGAAPTNEAEGSPRQPASFRSTSSASPSTGGSFSGSLTGDGSNPHFPSHIQHHHRHAGDGLAWGLVARYLDAYYTELSGGSSVEGLLTAHTQRMGLPWIAFQQ